MIFYSTWYLGAATSTSISYEVGKLKLRTQRDLGLVVGLRALILECANICSTAPIHCKIAARALLPMCSW